jgi:hypothetical protein
MSIKSSLGCSVTVQNDIPQHIRSKTHLFEFDESNSIWTEQAFLFPSVPQNQDLMGASVAIDGEVAVVGSPNRELININSGSALFFNIGFLDFHFAADPIVKEGEMLDITVTRAPSIMTQLLSLRTLDRNAEDDLQHYVNELYSMSPYDKSAVDTLTGSTALGNEQRSLFVNGQYDYTGISDYEMLRYEGEFKPLEQSLSVSLKTNNDAILEKPHENATVQINLRGMFETRHRTFHQCLQCQHR